MSGTGSTNRGFGLGGMLAFLVTIAFSQGIVQGATVKQIIDASGDGVGATLNDPGGIAVSQGGNVYVVGIASSNVFKITPTGVIREIIDSSGDGIHDLYIPIDVAVDANGNVYVSGYWTHNAFKITPTGTIAQIIDYDAGVPYDPIVLENAYGVAVDGEGNVFVGGEESNNVFKITPAGTITQIIDYDAGDPGDPSVLWYPRAIVVDASGNVYVAGSNSDNVFKITPSGTITEIINWEGCGAPECRLGGPWAIALDESGNVYVGAGGTENVFKITPTGTITEIYDFQNCGEPWCGRNANTPFDLGVDVAGNLYVSTAAGSWLNPGSVFRITPGGAISRIMDDTGDGTHPFLGPAFQSLALGQRGNVYVSGEESSNAFKIEFTPTPSLGTPIPTKIGLLRWGGNPRVGKLYKIVSRPTLPLPLPACGTGVEPADWGGSVTVSVGDDTLTCILAASPWGRPDGGWKGLGKCKGGINKGYKYLNKEHSASNPCEVIILKEKGIKMLARGVGDISLPLAPPPEGPGNPDVSLELVAGPERYCALAQAPHSKEIKDTLIMMKDKAAPPECRVPTTTTLPTTTSLATTTTTVTVTTTTGTGPSTTTTTLTCDCSGMSQLAFETGIPAPGQTAGTLRNFRCLNNANRACVDHSECTPPGICAEVVSNLWCSNNPYRACAHDSDCKPPGTCIEMVGSGLPMSLDLGGLYIGGGLGFRAVQTSPAPDQSLSIYNTSGSSTLSLTPTTPAQVGQRNCTQGRTCDNNPSQHCVLDADCGAGTCQDNCLYGPPLPIPNASAPALSVCTVNVVDRDSSGTAECDGGDADVNMPLRSLIYFNGDLFTTSPPLPGVQPCPLCVPICQGGSKDGLPCRPNNPNRACVSGLRAGKPCTNNDDCPDDFNPPWCAPARTEYSDCINGGGTCPATSECMGGLNDGDPCTPATSDSSLLSDAQDSYPTSHDCANDPLFGITDNIGGLPIDLALTTGSTAMNAVDRPYEARVFCGYCRDEISYYTKCFEGDPRSGQLCPPSSWCNPPNGNCGVGKSCGSDDDCEAPYESCVQRNQGAFSFDEATRIEVSGSTDGQCMEDGLPHPANLVSIFCIPPAFDFVLDAAYDLPGPGAALLQGVVQLQSPSGAFMEGTSGVLD